MLVITRVKTPQGGFIVNRMAKKFLSIAATAVLFAGVSATASADDTWQKDHPRRAEVNGRLDNQNARIHQDVKDGMLTKGQAQTLHRDDHQIRSEERDMASQNGSHISKSEQHVLNQQENAVSSQIPPK
jgi:hypothetical protein